MEQVRKFLEDLERENGAGKPKKGGVRKPRTKKTI
jgi:hypothetical protein